METSREWGNELCRYSRLKAKLDQNPEEAVCLWLKKKKRNNKEAGEMQEEGRR
jgi:hypothetical protein